MRSNTQRHFAAVLPSLLRHALLAVVLAAGQAAMCGAALASVIHVSVDTSKFGVSTGYFDMNFSATSGVPLQTATVTNLTGFDSNPYTESWGLTPVPGGFQFRNDTSNDLFQAVHFGGILAFDLAFAGAVDTVGNYVSAFAVSAFSDDFAALGAFDPVSGALATFDWTPASSTTSSGGLGVAVADGSAVAVLPEPAGLGLLGIGFAALALARSRRRMPRG